MKKIDCFYIIQVFIVFLQKNLTYKMEQSSNNQSILNLKDFLIDEKQSKRNGGLYHKTQINLEYNIKKNLEKKLLRENSFWSFEKSSCRNLSDWNLIKYVLIYLDLDDIKYLFQLYPKKKVKEVWLQELVTQGDFLLSMNICFALLFFDAKRPRQYVKTMETKMLNKKLK